MHKKIFSLRDFLASTCIISLFLDRVIARRYQLTRHWSPDKSCKKFFLRCRRRKNRVAQKAAITRKTASLSIALEKQFFPPDAGKTSEIPPRFESPVTFQWAARYVSHFLMLFRAFPRFRRLGLLRRSPLENVGGLEFYKVVNMWKKSNGARAKCDKLSRD